METVAKVTTSVGAIRTAGSEATALPPTPSDASDHSDPGQQKGMPKHDPQHIETRRTSAIRTPISRVLRLTAYPTAVRAIPTGQRQGQRGERRRRSVVDLAATEDGGICSPLLTSLTGTVGSRLAATSLMLDASISGSSVVRSTIDMSRSGICRGR